MGRSDRGPRSAHRRRPSGLPRVGACAGGGRGACRARGGRHRGIGRRGRGAPEACAGAPRRATPGRRRLRRGRRPVATMRPAGRAVGVRPRPPVLPSARRALARTRVRPQGPPDHRSGGSRVGVLTILDWSVGVVLVGAAVAASAPRERTLLAIAAAAWLAGTLAPGADVLLTLHRGPLLHAAFAYPHGRLPGRLERGIVAIAWIDGLIP